jgi:hypothetical protein
MRATCLLLLTLANAALLSGGLYAAPTNPQSDQTASQAALNAVSPQSNRPNGDGGAQSDARQSGERQAPRRAEPSHPRVKVPLARPHRPQPIAAQRTLPQAVTPANLPSSAPAPSAVVNHGSPQNEAIYRALPVRPGSAIRPVARSAVNSRHRDPNPPVIGGALSSNSRNTAVIDGTRTKLKGSRN